MSLAALRAAGQVTVNAINTIAGGGPQPNLATSAFLPQPTSAVRDSAGNTYIAVPSLNTVFLVNTSGAISAYAGTGIAGFSGDGGAATKAQLNFPTGLAIDKNNNLFISDQNNERIRRVDASSHNIATVAGSEDPYFGAYGGDGGAATNARLNTPTGVAIDGNGNLFIADTGNAVVRRVDATTQVITTHVATNSPPVGVAAGCNSGVATNAILTKPTGVAVDGSGNLFVSDTSLDVVCKVDASQNVSTYAGTLNTPGVPGQNGDGGPATSAQIDRPSGVATDANGNLYITDSGNPSIRKVDTSANHIITTVAGLGTICSNEPGCGDGGPATRASLDFPKGVFVDANNNIVIADTFNMRVRVVSAANATIANLAGSGSGGDGGAATSAVLGLAQTLVLDASENVFALETAGERLRQIDTKGNISTVAGAGFGGATTNCPQPGCNGDGGPATSARFVSPTGVAADAQGNFLIVDSKAAVVRAINNQAAAITIAGVLIQPGQIATVAGNGTPCALGSASYPTCGDGSAATSASLDVPIGVALDAVGNIYISDQGLNTVRVVSQATGFINTFAGTPGKACTTYPTNCGDNGVPTAALLNDPAGLAVSAELQQGVPQPGATDVFIADSGDNVIRRVSIVSGIALIETISRAAFNGIATFGGDGGSSTAASMNAPAFIAVDNFENLYIGGGPNNVVRRVDAFNGRVSTVAGDVNNLNGGFSGDGGSSTQAMIENTGLAVFNTQQGTHDLFIADSGSNRIRKVNLSPVSSILPASGTTLTFPITLVGQTNTQPIELGNVGLDDLVISNLRVSDPIDFNVKPSSGCFGANPPIVAPPGGQLNFCSLNVNFTPGPNANGLITATLTFSTNDPANPNLTYALSGTAAQTTFPLSVTLTPAAGSGAAGGDVVSSPFGISCFTQFAGTCAANFAAGSTVTLTASPSSGFNFTGWGGACSGTASCQVLMNQAQNVTATFTPISPAPQMTINIVGFGRGSGVITDTTNAINCTITNGAASGTCSAQFPGTGTTAVMLTATPTAGNGSIFVGWLGQFCSPYNTNTCSVFPQAATVVLGSVFTLPAQIFTKGQVFLSTDFGMVFVLDPATGNVVQVLSSGNTGGEGKGLTFDTAGSLYMANSQANRVEQFAINGTGPINFGTGYQGPWSPLVQPSGNLLVGQTGQAGDTSGLPTVVQLPQGAGATTPPSTTFFPAFLDLFTQAYWIELLDVGDIIAYTTGTERVGVFDLGELTQHPDMITTLHGAFALRELPDDTLLIADSDRIVRIDQSGNIKQTYTIPSTGAFFRNLNLDPDGQSFWTNDELTGTLYRINIQTGAVMNGNGYSTGLGLGVSGLFTQGIGGIAVFGQALAGGADLGVTMTAPSAVQVGANVTYSLNVSNSGPLNATGVTLTASIPNSTVVSLSPNTCKSTSAGSTTNISCPIGNLAANSPAVAATFTMLPSSPGTITATANVAGNESDPNLANNTATVTTSTGPACTLSVTPNPVVAGFPTTAKATCSDAAGTIATTTLSFGDGTPVVNGAAASHTYSAAGTFTVTVTATDNLQLTGTASQAVTVSVNQPPSCTLTVAPTTGFAPLTVTVTGSCTDPENALSSTLLDFGDGSTQAAPSGTHTYTNAGTFTVKLTGTDNVGQKATATQTVTVAINTAPTCTLTVTPTTGVLPLPITATGNCVDAENNIKTIVLDFGDGTTVNAASGTHTYNATGTFTVKVTATDALGLSGSASQTVTVTLNNFPQGLFVGISPGTIKRFAPDGTLLQTLTTGLNGTVSGMGFDKAGNLYATDFTAGNVSKFDPKAGTLLGTFGSGFNCQPETIVFDGAGNAYVGEQGCSHNILKLDPAGKLLTTFTVATEEQGSDDIDLSADNCTLLYTSEGPSILRYDVCRNQQMTPFATGLKKALVLRILPDGGVIVGDLTDIVRLNASGQQVMTYTAPGEQCLYSVTLDQDGTSFWAGDYCSSNIYRFDINSGKQLTKFNSGTPSGTVFGLAISGSGLNVAGLGNAGNISTSPSSASLATGQSATFTVSFSPNAATAGHTLTLSCAGLPAGLSCSFNPPTITLGAAGTTTTSTLTISRTTTAALQHPTMHWMLATWMGVLPAVVLVGVRSPRRRRRSMMWLGIVVACTGIWASCGGGGGMSKSTTPAPTPQGTYTIIVVGNSGGMQASTTVNLTVQ